jgi:hypothetical protein
MTNEAALLELAEVEGYDDTFELLEAAITDSVCPAICVECGYTCEMEPDQDRGWCEECQKNTVKSALVLGGIY